MLPARGSFALVGRNGSGKSSLIRVLLGLQPQLHGEVRLAGQRPQATRSAVAARARRHRRPGHDPVSGTFRENVAAGSQVSCRAQIVSALAFADALGFVEAMPDGLDAELEENGRNLSGGQRQRLADRPRRRPRSTSHAAR